MFFIKDRDLPLVLQFQYIRIDPEIDTEIAPPSASRFVQQTLVASTNSALTLSAMSASRTSNNAVTRQLPAPSNITPAQALEYGRDSEDGAQDPTVRNVLETAVKGIWARIQAQPSSYVLTREEFAIFNYFQDCYQDQVASAARKRYWNQVQGSNGN